MATYETFLASRALEEGVIGRVRVDKKGKQNEKNYLNSCKADAYSSESHMFFSKHVQYNSLICK